MVLYYLPIVSLFLYRLFFKRSFSPLNLYGDFILLIYLFPLGLGFFYALSVQGNAGPEISAWAMFYLSFAFFLYFSPLFYFQTRREFSINLINKALFKLLCVFLLFGGIYAIVLFIPKAIFAIQFGAADFRARTLVGDITVFTGSMYETIAVGFSSFFGLSQLLAFLVLATKLFGRMSNFFAIGLLASSTSYIFNSFAFAGRDGVIFWGISFVFCYVFIRRWVSLSLPRSLWLFLVLVLGTGVGIFVLITINRFDHLFYIFSYGAQQLYEFNALFVIDPPLYNGWNGFREILSALGMGGELSRQCYWNYYLSNNVQPWTFKFFIGSLFRDFGKVGTLISLLIPSTVVFLWLVKKRKQDSVTNVVPLDHVILIYLYGQIGFMGVFYFKHSALNWYLVVFLILIFLLRGARLVGFRWVVNFQNIKTTQWNLE